MRSLPELSRLRFVAVVAWTISLQDLRLPFPKLFLHLSQVFRVFEQLLPVGGLFGLLIILAVLFRVRPVVAKPYRRYQASSRLG